MKQKLHTIISCINMIFFKKSINLGKLRLHGITPTNQRWNCKSIGVMPYCGIVIDLPIIKNDATPLFHQYDNRTLLFHLCDKNYIENVVPIILAKRTNYMCNAWTFGIMECQLLSSILCKGKMYSVMHYSWITVWELGKLHHKNEGSN